MINYLIEQLGNEQVDKILFYAFEYACQEAEFYQVRKRSKDYQKDFNSICKLRRDLILLDIANEVINLRKKDKGQLEIIFNNPNCIIHKRYNNPNSSAIRLEKVELVEGYRGW